MAGQGRSAAAQRGVSLVELLFFILIVSVALGGVISVYGIAITASANPMIRKQALSAAEALLAEVQQQPFTYCDLADANLSTATSTAGCTGGAAASEDQAGGTLSGPMPSSETRYSSSSPFNNVADYGGFVMNPIYALDDAGTALLDGYSASVSITRAGTSFSLPNDAVLRIAVRVWNGVVDITLVGYRFRYAPNLL